jgi:hypothetical protein
MITPFLYEFAGSMSNDWFMANAELKLFKVYSVVLISRTFRCTSKTFDPSTTKKILKIKRYKKALCKLYISEKQFSISL